MLHKVYLAFGANMGDRILNLKEAVRRLGPKVEIKKCSGIYDTAPVGNTEQPRFLNMVCLGETSLSPQELLSFIKKIETDMGRKPGPVNSPRPIDIDILFYDEIILNEPALVIPHPRIGERVFVWLPLSEIAPDFIHPVTSVAVRHMLGKLKRAESDILKLTDFCKL
ncbi:MAG: 2-amino-4-hydroxy-6-hydroxymethyldihydropteridine diphosphokinase [Dehalococcoidales bacterium]|nr:2-amino-4-hydroxy-6-hydroxymethyldihydropteridine diphosphokinase [Dehalococcoidales bacterium]